MSVKDTFSRLIRKFVEMVIGRAEARVGKAVDEAAVDAKGKPVDEVRAALAASLKKQKVNLGEETLDEWAAKLARGERPSTSLKDLGGAGTIPNE